jgi:hypothetical protein
MDPPAREAFVARFAPGGRGIGFAVLGGLFAGRPLWPAQCARAAAGVVPGAGWAGRWKHPFGRAAMRREGQGPDLEEIVAVAH